MAKPFINISTYQFAPLSGLKPLRARLLRQCRDLALKGTILISPEGINLFVAGSDAAIQALLDELRRLPGLETLKPKVSESEHQPFTRMLVRIKKEIIAFGVPGIDPARRTSPKLAPKDLKRWLDEGRPVTLLDTRNDYEIKLGTFENAQAIGIQHFRDFPKAVAALPVEMKTAPIVMFCTGGIRCEKAGPYLESQGFQNVLQLDGGILKYFEECGASHYRGDCFVFDQRVGVDPSLHETPSAQCFVCLTPLTAEEQGDPRYEQSKSCPYCFKTTEEQMADQIREREQAIRKVTSPLPGSTPYENRRPLRVPGKYEGMTLIDFVCTILDHISREEWNAEMHNGRFLDSSGEVVSGERLVYGGERYFHLMPCASEPEIDASIRIRYEDEAIVVIDKPAPLPIHPGGRYNRNTLKFILEAVYAPQRPRAAHRLDANTTGLMVIARTRHFAGIVQAEFGRGEVEKVYRALVQGHPAEDDFVCELPIGEETLDVGARSTDENGLAARTEFKVIERRSDGTSLLEARPITGRTNQIRVHLWQLGLPICGEQMYLPNQTLGKTQTTGLNEPKLCLHAFRLGFTHPLTKQRMLFESAPRF